MPHPSASYRHHGFAVLLALLLGGCPSKSGSKPSTPAPCARFGDSCEFSPGKLGSCVERTNCSGPNCLTCQSQH